MELDEVTSSAGFWLLGGGAATATIMGYIWSKKMEWIPLPDYITPDTRAVPVEVRVSNNHSEISHVRVQVIPPGWQPPVPVVDPDDPLDPEIYYFPEGTYFSSFYNVFFTQTSVSDDGNHGIYSGIINFDDIRKVFGNLEGEYGYNGIYLGLPVRLGKNGVGEIVKIVWKSGNYILM